MKSKLKFVLFSILFIMVSCGICKERPKENWETIGGNGRLIELCNKEITQFQLDSIMVSDTLNRDLNKWVKSIFGPDNYGNSHIQYIYVKKWKTQDTYVVEQQTDSTYNIIMRKICSD